MWRHMVAHISNRIQRNLDEGDLIVFRLGRLPGASVDLTTEPGRQELGGGKIVGAGRSRRQ